MSEVGVGMAFVAGVVSFLSPCVLPLVPGYVSFMSGLSAEEPARGERREEVVRKAGVGALFFGLGFSAVFVALGASASAVGRLLDAYMPILSKAAGALVVLFGLYMTGVLRVRWLLYQKRAALDRFAPGPFGAFLMGVAFAFGWTPCIGPVLAGILALAARQATVREGVVLLAAYSLGLGIPFFLAAVATASFTRLFARYKSFLRWSELVAGVLLIAVGALIFSNRLTALVGLFPRWLLRFAL